MLITATIPDEAYQQLAEADVAVLLVTSDPGALCGGFPGALGVMRMPVMDLGLV